MVWWNGSIARIAGECMTSCNYCKYGKNWTRNYFEGIITMLCTCIAIWAPWACAPALCLVYCTPLFLAGLQSFCSALLPLLLQARNIKWSLHSTFAQGHHCVWWPPKYPLSMSLAQPITLILTIYWSLLAFFQKKWHISKQLHIPFYIYIPLKYEPLGYNGTSCLIHTLDTKESVRMLIFWWCTQK